MDLVTNRLLSAKKKSVKVLSQILTKQKYCSIIIMFKRILPTPLTQRLFCVKGVCVHIGIQNHRFLDALICIAVFPCREDGILFCQKERKQNQMETRVAVMSIIVEDPNSAEPLNALLHEYGDYIIGRMGIPYRRRKISIISVAIDAPQNTIAALSGKIGKLSGVSVKTAYSAVIGGDDDSQ